VNITDAREFADNLTGLGCRFALDDFGAGFGSFYYLKHLPFDYLKIDGDFIRNLAANPADQLMVKALVDVAKGLGKHTIAEFVGDEATVRLLREYGVDLAQGYHLGRPQKVTETLVTAG
jgi:EAL domain-containing protein (putative c-di-GMP-specific phosphodiesterase class I)